MDFCFFRNITKIPTISNTNQSPTLTKGGAAGTLAPTTKNYNETVSQVEPSGYLFTVADRRVFSSFIASGQGTAQEGTTSVISNPVAVSETVIGNTLTFLPISTDSLFGTNTQLTTIITIEGRDTGARASVTVTINKN